MFFGLGSSVYAGIHEYSMDLWCAKLRVPRLGKD